MQIGACARSSNGLEGPRESRAAGESRTELGTASKSLQEQAEGPESCRDAACTGGVHDAQGEGL